MTDARADGVPSKVVIVRSDNGGKLCGGELGEVCKQFFIEQEFTDADSPKQNGVIAKALGIIQNAALAACIQVPIIFAHVQLPPTISLWAEAMHWADDALNHTVTTANPGTSGRMKCGMGLPHMPRCIRSFTQHTVTGRSRRSRSLGPRAVFTSGWASTTQVTLCECSRRRTRRYRRGT